MPSPYRPDDLPETWARACAAGFDACAQVPPEFKRPPLRAYFLDVWESGVWLKHRLVELGLPDAYVRSINFAHGQRSLGTDAWKVARDALAEARRGEYTPPGPLLADAVVDRRSLPYAKLPGVA